MAGWLVAVLSPRPVGPGLTEDEHEYLRAAAHLARSGRLSFAPLDRVAEPGAYREPGYPALLAFAWRIADAPVPATPAALGDLARTPRLASATRGVNALLFALAIAAAGSAGTLLAGGRAGALAAALVAASPALHERVTMVMSETLAAALLMLVAGALVARWRGYRYAGVVSLVLVALLPLARSECILLVPVGAAVVAATARGNRRRRRLVGLAFGVVALLPSFAWAMRNERELGHFVLADRSGLALAMRAALDADIARAGFWQPVLAWTPVDAAQRRSRAMATGVDFLDYRWVGRGNYLTRTIRAWTAARQRPGADPLAVDRTMRRASLEAFAEQPLAHLEAVPAVAWRGLFAERSPEWAWPFDLRLGIGLLLALSVILATRAGRHERALLVLLAPAWVLFAFHAAATEFLPRYSAPLLPLVWTAVAVLVAGPRQWERRSPD